MGDTGTFGYSTELGAVRTDGRENTLKLIKDNDAVWVDLRFTDPRGKEQHTSIPASRLDADAFGDGFMFDGSSISGWKSINESDMILMPDDDTPVLDPFRDETTVNLRCDIVEPSTMQPYERDPRSVAKLAEAYLKSTGVGDEAYFGPENEFFVFDDVRWKVAMEGASYAISAEEAAWESHAEFDGGNIGHRPGIKGGYFPVPPVDSGMDLRSAMCTTMRAMGLPVEVHHHEVGTAGQGEIGVRFNTLVRKADEVQIYKYVVHNVAHAYGKTATFMPKPIVGDNGNGAHVHQSISAGGENVFYGDAYAGLSDTALYYIGGIIKHARAINAFSNAATNSYKRLVPGFEAPVLLAYSARQPLGLGPGSLHSGRQSEGLPGRGALPGLHGQPVSDVCLDAHGRPRWDPEQDPSGRFLRQGPLRPGTRGAGRRAHRGSVAGDRACRAG